MPDVFVTVIIPEHKRPHHLKRLLEYYCASGIRTIVSDSSEAVFPFLHEFEDRIVYRHYPGMPLAEKLYRILPLIKTPFVFMCANDDFIVPAAVANIIDHLRQNPAYNSGQGIFTDFSFRDGKISTAIRYASTTNIDLNMHDAGERMQTLMSNYFQYYYCVFRSSVFQQVITSVMKDDKARIRNLVLLELYISIWSAIDGKHLIAPIYYASRENIPGSAAALTDTMLEILTKKKYESELADFYGMLANKLTSTNGIFMPEAVASVKEAIQIYVERLRPGFFSPAGRMIQKFKNLSNIRRLRSMLRPSQVAPASNFSPLSLKGGDQWHEVEKYILLHQNIYR